MIPSARLRKSSEVDKMFLILSHHFLASSPALLPCSAERGSPCSMLPVTHLAAKGHPLFRSKGSINSQLIRKCSASQLHPLLCCNCQQPKVFLLRAACALTRREWGTFLWSQETQLSTQDFHQKRFLVQLKSLCKFDNGHSSGSPVHVNVTLQESDRQHHSNQRSNPVLEDSFHWLTNEQEDWRKTETLLCHELFQCFFPDVRFDFGRSNKHPKGMSYLCEVNTCLLTKMFFCPWKEV